MAAGTFRSKPGQREIGLPVQGERAHPGWSRRSLFVFEQRPTRGRARIVGDIADRQHLRLTINFRSHAVENQLDRWIVLGSGAGQITGPRRRAPLDHFGVVTTRLPWRAAAAFLDSHLSMRPGSRSTRTRSVPQHPDACFFMFVGGKPLRACAIARLAQQRELWAPCLCLTQGPAPAGSSRSTPGRCTRCGFPAQQAKSRLRRAESRRPSTAVAWHLLARAMPRLAVRVSCRPHFFRGQDQDRAAQSGLSRAARGGVR